jgi:acetyl-CoA carboxylase biotin carboxyl carrier protein
LNHRYLLVMPDGFSGTVEREPDAGVRGVGFGEILFHLHPLADERPDSGAAARSSGALPGAGDLPGGGLAVCAPTDGVFYRRPSPEAPPFVEVGNRVSKGQPVGLVEVMKTFNQIVYGGPGMPDEAEVVEVRCEDGEEVSAGQALVVVR